MAYGLWCAVRRCPALRAPCGASSTGYTSLRGLTGFFACGAYFYHFIIIFPVYFARKLDSKP
eukprot:5869201-Prymnesium_polylepis.1